MKMNTVLMVMPLWMRPYAKTVVAVLGAILSGAVALYGDNPAVATLVSFATALGVYVQPNEKVGE